MKTPQTSCRALRDDLKAYLDGELLPLRRLSVQFHLRHCPACRAEVQTMTQISHDLKNSENAAPLSPRLRERILENLPAPTQKISAPQPVSSPLARKKNPLFEVEYAAYATGFCLVALVIISSLSLTSKNTPQTFNSASVQLNDGGSYSNSASEESAQIATAAPEYNASSAADSQKEPSFSEAVENRRAKVKAFPSTSVTSAPNAPSPKDTSNLPAALRKVHKEARLTVAVNDIEAQSAAAEQSVRAAGGYIVSNDLSTGTDNRKSARLDLRVPVGRFDSMVIELSGLGEVRAKQVTGEDITEQFSDSQQAKNVLTNELTTRELQLKEALARVEAAQKKKKYMADPWELRAEVRRLRVEASQVRARFELMRKLSALSAITLDLKEKSLTPTGGFSQEMGETVRGAGDTFLVAARLPIKLFIWLFAFSPLWLPMLIAYRLLSRRVSHSDTSQQLR